MEEWEVERAKQERVLDVIRELPGLTGQEVLDASGESARELMALSLDRKIIWDDGWFAVPH